MFYIRSKCYLEQDACKRQIDIKANHMGQCNNCENVICPFHGQCQSQQGNYTCICPIKQSCSYIRVCSFEKKKRKGFVFIIINIEE